MNRLVQLSVNTPSPSSELKVRIYYPVRLLTGPDLQVCRTYTEYLSYYGEDPFAQLLFGWNYELLCHRVSYVNSKANLTKYEIEGDYKYYQDTDRYLLNPNIIEPSSGSKTHKNSLLITINQELDNYNDFYIILRSKTKSVTDLIYSYSIGLFGCDFILSQGQTFDEGKLSIQDHFDLEPLSRSMFLPEYDITEQGYIDRRLDLNSFDITLYNYLINCGLIVEPLGYHRYLVSSLSEDISYSILSNIVSVEELEDYYDRYYASIYKNHRILSISSKYKMAQDSINVNIEKLDTESYSIHVIKHSGEWIDEEYFIVDPYVVELSTNTVRSFEEVNLISNYIDIDVYQDYKYFNYDITGNYELKNSFGFNDNELFLNKVTTLTGKTTDGYYFNSKFYIDLEHINVITPELGVIYEDLLNSLYYVWDGFRYINIEYTEFDPPQPDAILLYNNDTLINEKLRESFPQALIITAPGDEVNNGIRVDPSTVYWFNFDSEIPSGIAVLNLLMTTSYYNDATQFRLPETYPIISPSSYDLRINQSDYGMEIASVYVNRVNNDLKYSIRAFVARAMIYRICKDISEINSRAIRNYINRMCSQVGTKLKLNLSYRIKNESVKGRTYKADLMILVDNRLFTRFEINTELNYEG